MELETRKVCYKVTSDGEVISTECVTIVSTTTTTKKKNVWRVPAKGQSLQKIFSVVFGDNNAGHRHLVFLFDFVLETGAVQPPL